jgi:LAO/AO transport system kinase
VGDPAELLERARAGDRRALGRALSLCESAAADPEGPAARAFDRALDAAHAGPPRRVIGVTGPPGAGKSTLAGVLAAALLARGRRVWVLAVDPTSPITGGALLGDRVRMPAGGVMIRSFATRGAAGGLSAALSPALRLAGHLDVDDVLVETVGAGQADVAVTRLADVTVLVVAPGLGDEVQALKAGIAELADIVCVAKADRPDAAEALRHWRTATAGLPDPPLVVSTSAVRGEVGELLAALDQLAGRPRRPVRPGVAGARRHALGLAELSAGRGDVLSTFAHLAAAAGTAEVVTAADLAPADAGRPAGLVRLVHAVSRRLGGSVEPDLGDRRQTLEIEHGQPVLRPAVDTVGGVQDGDPPVDDDVPGDRGP